MKDSVFEVPKSESCGLERRRDREPARPGHRHRHRPRRLGGQRDRVAGVVGSAGKPFHHELRRGRERNAALVVIGDGQRHIRRVARDARRRQLAVRRRPRNHHPPVRRIDLVVVGRNRHRTGARRQAGRDRELRAGLREVRNNRRAHRRRRYRHDRRLARRVRQLRRHRRLAAVLRHGRARQLSVTVGGGSSSAMVNTTSAGVPCS